MEPSLLYRVIIRGKKRKRGKKKEEKEAARFTLLLFPLISFSGRGRKEKKSLKKKRDHPEDRIFPLVRGMKKEKKSKRKKASPAGFPFVRSMRPV